MQHKNVKKQVVRLGQHPVRFWHFLSIISGANWLHSHKMESEND